MKTIFTLLKALFMGIAVFAADGRGKSILTIKSVTNTDIRVVLDGKRFEPNDNAIVLSNLEDGFHTVKVYRQRNGGLFSISGKRYEMIYNTTIAIKKRTHTTIIIDRNGRAAIQETRLDNGRNNRDWDDRRHNDDDYREYDIDRDGQYGDYDRHNGYAAPMSDREFRAVLQSIDREWLESNKLKSATQVVRANSFSAAQVKEIILLFSFENNKLEVAKQAYANTVDKRNYSMIYDVFSFNSSKAELERFIRNKR
jgi:hypothetical protein